MDPKKGLTSIPLICALFISLMACGQENGNEPEQRLQRKNTVDISLGGTGLFASVNYSRMLLTGSGYFISSSAGIGVIPFVGGMTFPHQLTCNLGRKDSFLELGIGGSYWSGKSNTTGNTQRVYSYHLSPIIGWRKNFGKSMVFRLYTNPLFHISGEYYIENYSIIPYLGLSLGYRF